MLKTKSKVTMISVGLIILIVLLLIFSSDKNNAHNDLYRKVKTALEANPDLTGVQVAINNGTATITGRLKDSNAIKTAEAIVKGIEGIKNIQNRTVLSEFSPVAVTADDSLTNALRPLLKDNPTVSAIVSGGVIILQGEIKEAELNELIQKIQALNPKRIETKNVVLK